MIRKKAREILVDSFLELAETKSVEKITVNDIVNNCDYSPSTFYRYYRDKYDLIARHYAEQMGVIMTRIDINGYSWDDAYLDAARYYEEQKSFLANLFLNTNGLDSFLESMTDINCACYRDYLLRKTQKEKLDKKTELLIRLYCLGASKLVSEWILGKITATASEIADILKEGFAEEILKTEETGVNL
ncbi:MAG: TetR/AcrR family transcriptional regulator C-terminal domain-containing protein [Lachnospiraceae bacterium]|nr:TetR/AcrR family transcriptional regulator C-terminal domain-containing protein [Lachnospiraceae bacterium]